MEGMHYTRYYGMKAHYYTYLVEDGRTIQGDALNEESALK